MNLSEFVEGDTVDCVFTNFYDKPADEPAVTPTDPGNSDGPAATPTDGGNNDDQGVLPHTGAGITLMVGLLALVLIGGGLVLRYASRSRKH